MYGSVGRYYLEKTDDFPDFLGSSILVLAVLIIVVGFINIGLNYMLIPKFDYSIAAVTTAFFYFLLMFLNYFTVRYLLRENVLQLRMFLLKFGFTLLFFLLLYGITANIKVQFVSFVIKIIAISVWGYLVFIKQIFLSKRLSNFS